MMTTSTPTHSPEEIGKTVKLYFSGKGMNQDEIAKQLGMTRSNVSNILRGIRPFSVKQARLWSETFGFNAAYLLTGEGKLIDGENVAIAGDEINIGNFRDTHNVRDSQIGNNTASEELRIENAKLTAENATLRKLLDEKERTITILLKAQQL